MDSVCLLLVSALYLNLHRASKLSYKWTGYNNSTAGAVDPLPLQVVPQGIEAVNGSSVTMGCNSEDLRMFTNSNSVIVMFCGEFFVEGGLSYLVDGDSPAIDTSTSDWASQLVTVRKTQTDEILFDHVVLTFDFVGEIPTFTAIELDLFLCPEWNIGAPCITVYADDTSNFNFDLSSTVNLLEYDTNQLMTSCNSLSTVCVPLEGKSTHYTWHILISFSTQPSIEWVHIGEVRFLDTLSLDECTTSLNSLPTPSTTKG